MHFLARRHHLSLSQANSNSNSATTYRKKREKKTGWIFRPFKISSLLKVSLMCAVVCLIPLISTARSAQITLTWNASESGTDGYRLYQRMSNEAYNFDQPVWTGTTSTAVINGLAENTTYYFVVRAHDGNHESGNSNEVGYTTPDSNEQVSGNQAPAADAGNNQTVTSKAQVILDGSGSYDPENQALTYHWQQTAGQSVTLSQASQATAAFVAPVPTSQTATLAFELTVTDPQGLSSADTCLVLVDSALLAVSNSQSASDTSDASGEGQDADQYSAGDNADANANRAPEQPVILSPADGDTVDSWKLNIQASAFTDPDTGDQHASTQWIISTLDDAVVVMDFTSTSRHLESVWIPFFILDPKTAYTCKVRYSDSQDLASEWSPKISFTTKDRIAWHSALAAQTDVVDDLNQDGVDDSLQSNEIQTIYCHDGRTKVGIRMEDAPSDAQVTSLKALDPESLEEDVSFDTAEFPYGMLGYKIEMAEPGQSVSVQLFFSEPIDLSMPWYRYSIANGWQLCTDNIQFNAEGNGIERQLSDGGEQDADGVANGIIVDIVGPRSSEANTSLYDESGPGSDGSGKGCFLQSLLP